jgi:ketosteroid isomerase-like protein
MKKKNAAIKPVAPVKPVRITRPNDRDIFATWIRGYESGDVSLLMSIFSANLSYLEPCEPEQTFESLANWYKYDFARKDPRPTWTFRTESVDVGGDLAVIVSRWTAVTHFDGFQAEVRRLRSIDFLRFGEGGWKIFRTINDSLPCGDTPRAPRASVARKKK